MKETKEIEDDMFTPEIVEPLKKIVGKPIKTTPIKTISEKRRARKI